MGGSIAIYIYNGSLISSLRFGGHVIEFFQFRSVIDIIARTHVIYEIYEEVSFLVGKQNEQPCFHGHVPSGQGCTGQPFFASGGQGRVEGKKFRVGRDEGKNLRAG